MGFESLVRSADQKKQITKKVDKKPKIVKYNNPVLVFHYGVPFSDNEIVTKYRVVKSRNLYRGEYVRSLLAFDISQFKSMKHLYPFLENKPTIDIEESDFSKR